MKEKHLKIGNLLIAPFPDTPKQIVKLLIYIVLRKKIGAFENWKLAAGDKTFRLDYNLNSESVVFDLGGYEGLWSDNIFKRYGSNLFIFEPIKEFAQNIEKRFSGNSKIKIYDFGLAGETKKIEMNKSLDSSSAFVKNSNKEIVQLKKISDFIKENNIKNIDLIKINIEGGEYEVLEDLIENALIKNIKNIQVQFHSVFPNAKERMEKIQAELIKTHHPTYQYKFVWENWEIN